MSGTSPRLSLELAAPLNIDFASASADHASAELVQRPVDSHEADIALQGYQTENCKHAADAKEVELLELPASGVAASASLHIRSSLNWRPLPLRTPYLVLVILLSLALAILVEVLYRRLSKIAKAKGGILRFDSVQELTISEYFMWRYMLPITIITYGALVGAVDHQLMRMAPFYKLSRPIGLSGRDTFLRDPISYITYLRRPIKAGPLIWTSALMTILATVVAPIVQEFIFFIRDQDSKTAESFEMAVFVASVPSRILTVTLVLIACSCFALHLQIHRQHSGLSQAPAGMHGLLSAALGGGVLDTFRDLDIDIHTDHIGSLLESTRFGLREGCIRRLQSHDNPQTAEILNIRSHAQRLYMPPWYTISMLFFGNVVTIVCITTTISTLRVITLKVSWLTTVLAVLYKMLWSQLDVFARTTEPYWQLTVGQAHPNTLFVDYSGLPAIALPFAAIRNQHWHLALLSFCTVLGEILVICTSSLSELNLQALTAPAPSGGPNYAHRLNESGVNSLFWAFLIMGCLIPCVMSTSLLLARRQRNRSWLPRAPGTLASLLLHMHSTKLVSSLEHMVRQGKCDRQHQQKQLETEGKRYALGWFETESRGAKRIAIDEEPRAAKFERDRVSRVRQGEGDV